MTPIRRRVPSLLRLIAGAYEHRALGVTVHWPFEEWGRSVPELDAAVTLFDRLVRHGVVVVTSGESFRTREARARGSQSWSNKEKGTREGWEPLPATCEYEKLDIDGGNAERTLYLQSLVSLRKKWRSR